MQSRGWYDRRKLKSRECRVDILDMQVDWTQTLGWISASAAVAAAVGAIASAIVARKVYVSQTRPEVIVYIEHDRSKATILLWVKNIGNGVAYDVSFDIDALPGLDEIERAFVERLNEKGIRMIAPGSSVNSIVGVSCDETFDGCESLVPVSVSYYGRKGKKGVKLEGEFILDYGMYLKSIYADTEEYLTRRALEKLSGELASSTKTMKSVIAAHKK